VAAHEAASSASSRSEAKTAAAKPTAVPATITDPDSDHAASLAAAASSASPAPSTPSQPHSAAHAGTSQTANTAITQPVHAASGNTNETSNRNDSRDQSGSSAASTQAVQPKQPSAAGANSNTEATQKAPENASGRLALPNATPGGLAGLLDVIAESPEDVALSDLASLLSFEVDDLFPLIDAGTMLGVLSIHDGRAHLTDQGMAWHNADILESKTVFAQLALEHAPLVRMIDQALKKSKSGRLRGELILDLLRNRHEDAKARQQFHIAVTWGRYGELFDYDADDDTLILDEENM
jgi:NitT/TauT family transport system ATP-binding protein